MIGLPPAQATPLPNAHPAMSIIHNAKKKHIKQNRQRQQGQKELTEAEKIALAEQVYNNVWQKSSSAYGATGQPAPTAAYLPGPTIHPGAEATTIEAYEGSPPRVELSKQMVDALASKPSRAKRQAKETLLHEWAHVYQEPEMIRTGNDAELAANMFADYYSKKLLGINPEKNWAKFGPFKDFVKRYGVGEWRRKQFGTNYGRNPQEITYG